MDIIFVMGDYSGIHSHTWFCAWDNLDYVPRMVNSLPGFREVIERACFDG